MEARPARSVTIPRPRQRTAQMFENWLQLWPRLDVQVDAADKEINDRINFGWTKHVKLNGTTLALIDQLQKDVEKLTPPTKTTTALHGDFHGENILRSAKGDYSVLDWDDQKFGRPELDAARSYFWHPSSPKEFSEIYNATATQPMNETLLTAHVLAGSIQHYSFNLKPVKEEFGIQSQLERDNFRAVWGPRISDLGNRMHELTGMKIYADATSGLPNFWRSSKKHAP